MKIDDDRLTCFGYGFFFAIPAFFGSANIFLSSVFYLISAVFVVSGILFPKRLNRMNKILNSFFSNVQHVLSNVFLFFIYFLIFTPMALLMRASGRDLINIKTNRKTSSYWLKHKDNRTKEQYFKDPF